jgi:alkylation response protein AidB-like acyl-CoA dehydrogenase
MADDLSSFRAELGAWLDAVAPPSMRAPYASLEGLCWGGKKTTYPPDVQRWLQVMAERGYTAPTWPKEYGGGGLDPARAQVLKEELAARSLRPPLVGFGLSMLGPLLLQAGSEHLKKEHLPRIVRGEIRWCQGYSEPGSGSDLASLSTKAVRDGDHFVLNGQKIWTSFAELADWMFILVRTSQAGKKQDGITFLLMDMTSPGVTVKPIRLISGASPFCETFVADVRVPVANVVGAIDQGWPLARALLGHERNMISDLFQGKDDTARLVAALRARPNPVSRDRAAELEIDQLCFDLTFARAKSTGHESSIFKLYGTELNQRRKALHVSLAGTQALGWRGPGFSDEELKLTRDWLRSRGNTIEGGTSEIQLNIIAKRVLGLPEK